MQTSVYWSGDSTNTVFDINPPLAGKKSSTKGQLFEIRNAWCNIFSHSRFFFTLLFLYSRHLDKGLIQRLNFLRRAPGFEELFTFGISFLPLISVKVLCYHLKAFLRES